MEEKAQKPRAKKKKWILLSSCVLIIVVVVTFILIKLCNPAIYSVDITVDLNQDGSARITEVWDVRIVDGGEYFITKYDLLKGQDIHDLTVHDETGREYTPVENWNVKALGSDKYGKSGMVKTKGGYELCWGIYGDYGKHTYTVQYTMDGLLQGYQGKDAIYQTFVADNLISSPKKVNLTIQKEGVSFTPEDTRVWGFGTKGEIYVENGKVVLRTKGSLKKEERVAVLVGFDETMFSPAVENKVNFVDLKSKALKGSGYVGELASGAGGGVSAAQAPVSSKDSKPAKESKSLSPEIILMLSLVGWSILFIIIAIIISKLLYKAKAAIPDKYKDVPYSRKLPWDGDIVFTYTCLDYLGKLMSETSLLTAYLLRWIHSGQISIDEPPENDTYEEDFGIKLHKKRKGMSKTEDGLYKILLTASSAGNILYADEFRDWNEENPDCITDFFDQVKNNANIHMQENGIYQPIQNVNAVDGWHWEVEYSELGEKYVREMFGFKKYLENFTIIDEREIKEVQLWDEYLVFAQIFGIADKVEAQFSEIYPEYFEGEQFGNNSSNMRTISSVSENFHWAADTGIHASHSSYSSSSGGGGGSFSGGGGSGSGGSGGGGGGGGTR